MLLHQLLLPSEIHSNTFDCILGVKATDAHSCWTECHHYQPTSPSRWLSSVQFSHSVMSDSLHTRGLQHTSFPVHHQLPELTEIHVYWVGDAIQSSHLLWSPSPPTFNLSQHQCLFKWASNLHQVAKVLEFQLQHQSFQLIFRTDFL